MSNRPDDFEFDDFFDDDSGSEFDFDDDASPRAGDFAADDMPVLDEPEEGGGNRTFVVLAIAMILLFIIGIGVIIFIATRPTGPNEAEQTATAVVIANSTVMAQLAATQTQELSNLQLTQTALAASPTPTETFTPTPTFTATNTPLPSDTPTPDLTGTAAFLALDAISMTQTALAASPTPTNTLLPTDTPQGSIDIASFYATEIAQATQISQFQQDAYATAALFATQLASNAADPLVGDALLAEQAETLAPLLAQATNAAFAGGQVDFGLATAAAVDATLAVSLAQSTSNAPGLQEPLNITAGEATLTAEALAAGAVDLPFTDPIVQQATAAALSALAGLSTPQSDATQAAFATRQAFVDSALLGPQQEPTNTLPATVTPTPEITATTSGLDVVNQTATALANSFLTATALAAPVTPTGEAPVGLPTDGFVPLVPTALPDTGLFDDITGGGSGGLGVLGIALLGLVGVIIAARVMRNRNK